MRKWRKKKQRKQKKTSANRSNAVKPNQIQSIKDGNNNNDNSNNNGWDMISDRGLLGEKKYFLDPQNSEEESNKKIGERTKKTSFLWGKKREETGKAHTPKKKKKNEKKVKKKTFGKIIIKSFPPKFYDLSLSLSCSFFLLELFRFPGFGDRNRRRRRRRRLHHQLRHRRRRSVRCLTPQKKEIK